jgi:hypothetical protein
VIHEWSGQGQQNARPVEILTRTTASIVTYGTELDNPDFAANLRELDVE